ncbi:MAG: HNH endonuclease [Acidobacteriia bacterium]|nr:HNH endonuclease [Terriglobia bacterium]
MKNRQSSPDQPCVYCGSTVTPTKREHVISQALGTFEQNWTLNCVCDECNHFFSRELELPLGRDSAEAFFRVDFGVKPPETADKFLNRRMRATLNVTGHVAGARVVMKPTEEKNGILPVLPPQVGVRRAGEGWRYILERDLNEESINEMTGGILEVKVIGREDDLPRLVQRLAVLGFKFVETDRFLDQAISDHAPVLVEHEFIVDTTLRRAAAKIAFNYATKVLGPEVMRRSDFDAVRRFVRFGEEPHNLVTAQRISILVGVEAETTRTHTCGLGWLAPRRELIAIVSLFNQVTYGIRMCQSESDEWKSVSSQHLFDPIKRTITDLLRS